MDPCRHGWQSGGHRGPVPPVHSGSHRQPSEGSRPSPTPHEVLRTIDEYLPNDAYTATLDWGLLRKWCLVASQSGTQQNKSKLNLDTTPVTIDDEEFDRWMGNRLNVSLGPRPLVAASAPQPATTASTNAAEYLALSKMLATNMLQFSQNIAAQVGTGAPISGGNTALATGKGFN